MTITVEIIQLETEIKMMKKAACILWADVLNYLSLSDVNSIERSNLIELKLLGIIEQEEI